MRIDLIWPGMDYLGSYSPAQLYPSCAQLVIEGESSGPLPKGIIIPEDLSHYSPGKTSMLFGMFG